MTSVPAPTSRTINMSDGTTRKVKPKYKTIAPWSMSSFRRLVSEIEHHDISNGNLARTAINADGKEVSVIRPPFLWTTEAIEFLSTYAESYFLWLFQRANLNAQFGGRTVLYWPDMRFVIDNTGTPGALSADDHARIEAYIPKSKATKREEKETGKIISDQNADLKHAPWNPITGYHPWGPNGGGHDGCLPCQGLRPWSKESKWQRLSKDERQALQNRNRAEKAKERDEIANEVEEDLKNMDKRKRKRDQKAAEKDKKKTNKGGRVQIAANRNKDSLSKKPPPKKQKKPPPKKQKKDKKDKKGKEDENL